MSKLTKDITSYADAQPKIRAGLNAVYEVAKASYGPAAGNALIELQYGDPLISRDGVTNAEKVYLEDAIENMAARVLIQASKKNNKKVGDGTTAVIILAYHLYLAASKMVASGMNQMEVKRILDKQAEERIAVIDAVKIPVTDKLLQQVAMVSAGDEATGQMIADIIKAIGIDGGVTVEDFSGVGIYNELVDGFYWRKGFTNVNLITDPVGLESKHQDPDILISDKKLATAADIAPILEKIIKAGGQGKELVLVGDVSDEVLGILLLNRLKGIINVVPVDVPVFGPLRSLVMEDLALVTGGTVYVQGANASDFKIDMLGGAGRVIINEFSTTIIDGDGDAKAVESRIGELRGQLKEAESPVTVGALKERLARLTGKVAIIRVGGATEVEQKEVKLRVEDAVCAVQAAIKDGVIAGGGSTLAWYTDSSTFDEVYSQPFRQLMENAGQNADKALPKIREGGYGLGHNLSPKVAFRAEPVNLIKAGIVDPASVIKEVVRNAASVASALITVKVAITYADRDTKND